jgi:hypothetical protein
MINKNKIHALALTCLIGFQPMPLKADMKEMTNSVMEFLMENKIIAGSLAAILSLYAIYEGLHEGYMRYQVYRIEKILNLANTKHSGSEMSWGRFLRHRHEKMAKILVYATKDPKRRIICLSETARAECKLGIDPIILQRLIERQEAGIKREIPESTDLLKHRLYQRYTDKLDPHVEKPKKLTCFDPTIAFYAFSFELLEDHNQFEIWKNNTTYFKKELDNFSQLEPKLCTA